MEEFERLQLVAKVCEELENHFGLSDKTVAEFVIDLATKARTFDKFKKMLDQEGLGEQISDAKEEIKARLPALAMPDDAEEKPSDMMSALENFMGKWQTEKDKEVVEEDKEEDEKSRSPERRRDRSKSRERRSSRERDRDRDRRRRRRSRSRSRDRDRGRGDRDRDRGRRRRRFSMS